MLSPGGNHTMRLVLTSLLFAALLGSSAYAGYEPACRSAQTKQAEPGTSGLQLTSVRYEVDVLGAVAVGHMIQELTNEGAATTVICEAPGGLRFSSLVIEIAGEQHGVSPDSRPKARGKRPPASFKLTSQPLERGKACSQRSRRSNGPKPGHY